MYASFEAAAIRQHVGGHNYQTARALVRALLDSGRVAYEQADKHNGGTAQILVDGERVGQASVLTPGMEYADRLKIKGWH
ncbi:hypothetical protein HOU70_gp50 [Arthrobacter phage Liebe]|uniref:Uncharacterized protein n=2 Tax=Arthrobacter virus Liebe TaxID=2734245 RepID=A0A3G2KHU8_9CAUD|nr:hypothetical protein HOU70_gp50 [Arthrobacter phage Liebe]AYN58531.1 hypothetical protein PBI_MAUREEN_50 [Arthrobacter phage Maureen]AZF93783.1 hypothetical protein PBI_LIEBE_50 [Arthrobacter phage Liebe]